MFTKFAMVTKFDRKKFLEAKKEVALNINIPRELNADAKKSAIDLNLNLKEFVIAAIREKVKNGGRT
jgi:hypothetical protein